MPKPNYKNLRLPAADTVVTRYLSLAGLALILARRELPLIRLGLFRDPFEGSAPESVMNQQVLIQGSRNMQIMQTHAAAAFYRQQMMGWGDDGTGRGYEIPDVFATMAKVRKARLGASYASCWQWGQNPKACGACIAATKKESRSGHHLVIWKNPLRMMKCWRGR